MGNRWYYYEPRTPECTPASLPFFPTNARNIRQYQEQEAHQGLWQSLSGLRSAGLRRGGRARCACHTAAAPYMTDMSLQES